VGSDAAKGDAVDLDWATKVASRSLGLGGKTVVWQPVVRIVARQDLVVVEQATRLVSNYALFAAQRLGGARVALWGHGVNLQADDAGLTRVAEAVKRRYTRLPHWFFAYTERGAARVRGMGLPGERITVVNNAIDSAALLREAGAVSSDDIAAMRERLDVHGASVGLYLGAFYREKRLRLLIDSAVRIRAAVPDFELVVAGAGPDAATVEAAAARHPWITAAGPVFGKDKAVLGRLARVLLMPGAVGLVVLDSFALGVPLVTVERAGHGPEIDYLEDGVNGVIVGAGDEGAFAERIIALLRSDRELATLRAGCAASVGRYTVDDMARRFADGVCAALAHR
jgi:glycosyltransferase involved in cell wall biosynthesis